MCLILVAWRAQPLYPCLIAANRDEFHARPTAPAQWWADRPDLLAGRDLREGGTWLGITRAGRFAALTNHRGPEPRREDAPSRGALVTSILESSESLPEILMRLREVGEDYNAFNVIFSDGKRLGIYESRRAAGRELGPGIYGLSNDLLDTPWPKLRNAKNRLAAALWQNDTKAILGLLHDDQPAPDHELPQTGVSLKWERLLSSAFVRAPEYGTRCSTIIRIDHHGRTSFDEFSYDASGSDSGRVNITFSLETFALAAGADISHPPN